VVLADAVPGGATAAAGWVAANAETVAAATADVEPLTVERLLGWHSALMVGSGLPAAAVGTLRDAQGWIGGTSPLDAALVTPPPDHVPPHVADLVAYANRDDVDPVAQAAVAHAQFEVIHPFADGNGRLGRVLVAWLLVRRLALVTPPPVSLRIAADRDGYLAGLTWFRLGDHRRWVRWFADVVTGAGRAQVALAFGVEELHRRWRARLSTRAGGRALRRDALAWQVLDLFPQHLAVTAKLVAEELDRSTRAAVSALDELVVAGVLTEHVPRVPGARGRPARAFVAPELLELVR
jgi:Fic family protein